LDPKKEMYFKKEKIGVFKGVKAGGIPRVWEDVKKRFKPKFRWKNSLLLAFHPWK
jgi:hypothetical protein